GAREPRGATAARPICGEGQDLPRQHRAPRFHLRESSRQPGRRIEGGLEEKSTSGSNLPIREISIFTIFFNQLSIPLQNISWRNLPHFRCRPILLSPRDQTLPAPSCDGAHSPCRPPCRLRSRLRTSMPAFRPRCP